MNSKNRKVLTPDQNRLRLGKPYQQIKTPSNPVYILQTNLTKTLDGYKQLSIIAFGKQVNEYVSAELTTNKCEFELQSIIKHLDNTRIPKMLLSIYKLITKISVFLIKRLSSINN